MKYILVTGGAGFIGSNFLHYILAKEKDLHIINLDKFTYAASPSNLSGIPTENHTLIRGDICDIPLLKDIFEARKIEGIINFAAESHVDNSIISPDQFIKTNIEGTFNLLERARKTWLNQPGQYKEEYLGARFYQISTDEVYGALGKDGSWTEDSPYSPNSPYSASKASADMLVKAYYKTYGLNTVISNCSNNYGPFQHDEKLIPTIIRNALNGTAIPLYGDGSNVRDWLYVDDHCIAIDAIFREGKAGGRYNIGAGNEFNNYDIALKICTLLDEIFPNISGKPYREQIIFTADRPGHDKRYSVNYGKLQKELGWSASVSFEKGLRDSVLFYLSKYKNAQI